MDLSPISDASMARAFVMLLAILEDELKRTPLMAESMLARLDCLVEECEAVSDVRSLNISAKFYQAAIAVRDALNHTTKGHP